MKTAHKIRMNPTPEQVEYLKRACGTRRFIYNWGREQWETQYLAYKAEQETVPEEHRVLKPPSALALKKQFHAIRDQDQVHKSNSTTRGLKSCRPPPTWSKGSAS